MNPFDVKISAFCLTTNSIKNGYPFIESIKSWLPTVDELLVIDGGSTDGTIEAIQSINDSKIRIISDEHTKWEENWSYSRMGKNFDRGYQEATGDVVIKFDTDYILHEMSWNKSKNVHKSFRKDCEQLVNQKKIALTFTRFNFILIDRYHVKSKKTLGVNKTEALMRGYDIHYGLDLDKWGWGYEPVNSRFVENGIHFGDMVRTRYDSIAAYGQLFNYDFALSDLETLKKIRFRHERAVQLQRSFTYKRISQPVPEIALENVTPEWVYRKYEKNNFDIFDSLELHCVELTEHPEIIQDRIKKLTSKIQGYSGFDKLPTAQYYILTKE